MIATELETSNPDVRLVAPDVERDASLSMHWLHGSLGHATLASMGVAEKDNKPTTLELERERVKRFIDRPDQLNWMIECGHMVVGSVWVDLEQVGTVPPPAMHIMIGDPNMRGKGIGPAALTAVIEYFEQQGYEQVYSRHLTKNVPIQRVLRSMGFRKLGQSYTDEDGLEWQNIVKAVRP